MNKILRHSCWLLGLLLLLTACSSGGGDDSSKAKPMLNIYVFAPDHPVLTRSGETAEGTSEENMIHKLQIWIYEHGSEKLIGYLELQGDQLANLNSSLHQEVFRMEIDDAYASTPSSQRNKVDVYVLANVSTENCGDAKGENSHRQTPAEGCLESAHIAPGYFCPATDKQVADYGLPMSGVMRNVTVEGESPVLKIQTAKLQRRVSKIRCVFSSLEGKVPVHIEGVELDESLIPEYEYLFFDDSQFYQTYRAETAMLFSNLGEIKTNDAPDSYVFDGNILTFVDKIDKGVQDNKLSEKDVFLKATDRQLTGVIYYRLGTDVTQRKALFEMVETGGFDRNHTWIIYGYFRADQLAVETVDVSTLEDTGSQDHGVYNW